MQGSIKILCSLGLKLLAIMSGYLFPLNQKEKLTLCFHLYDFVKKSVCC